MTAYGMDYATIFAPMIKSFPKVSNLVTTMINRVTAAVSIPILFTIRSTSSHVVITVFVITNGQARLGC